VWTSLGRLRYAEHVTESKETRRRVAAPSAGRMSRRGLMALAAGLAATACAPVVRPMGPPIGDPVLAADALVMADGARLPLHAWLPEGTPRGVMVALHGFNEYSRALVADAAPLFTQAGLALYAYDQRGFGAAPHRGLWPGAETLAADASAAARLIARRHPGLPLVMMGESMGGAVLILADAGRDPPPVQGYVLLAPAVLSRASMPGVARHALDLATRTVPAVATVSSAPPGFTPTNNASAWFRWSRDPMIIHATRVDAVAGLVDLMDAAVAAAPRFGLPRPGRDAVPSLILYGSLDRIVPQDTTRAVLRSMPAGGLHRVGYYEGGRHMLLRDMQATEVVGDIVAWMAAPGAHLPSGADRAGAAWLAGR